MPSPPCGGSAATPSRGQRALTAAHHDALREVIGPDGTLVVSTATMNLCNTDQVFDPANTPVQPGPPVGIRQECAGRGAQLPPLRLVLRPRAAGGRPADRRLTARLRAGDAGGAHGRGGRQKSSTSACRPTSAAPSTTSSWRWPCRTATPRNTSIRWCVTEPWCTSLLYARLVSRHRGRALLQSKALRTADRRRPPRGAGPRRSAGPPPVPIRWRSSSNRPCRCSPRTSTSGARRHPLCGRTNNGRDDMKFDGMLAMVATPPGALPLRRGARRAPLGQARGLQSQQQRQGSGLRVEHQGRRRVRAPEAGDDPARCVQREHGLRPGLLGPGDGLRRSRRLQFQADRQRRAVHLLFRREAAKFPAISPSKATAVAPIRSWPPIRIATALPRPFAPTGPIRLGRTPRWARRLLARPSPGGRGRRLAGSGGSLLGTATYVKEKRPSVSVLAVEAAPNTRILAPAVSVMAITSPPSSAKAGRRGYSTARRW